MIISAELKPKKLPLYSPLYRAVSMGSLERVKTLIVKEKENPMVKDINGDSCLHYAAN